MRENRGCYNECIWIIFGVRIINRTIELDWLNSRALWEPGSKRDSFNRCEMLWVCNAFATNFCINPWFSSIFGYPNVNRSSASDKIIAKQLKSHENTCFRGFFLCARRAHALRGESPWPARQWEGCSQWQGRHREVGSEGSRRQTTGL